MDSIATDTPHYHDFTPPFAIPSSWQWVRLGKISNYGECLNIPVDNISSEEWILELEDLEKGTATIIQVLSKKDRNIKGVRHKFDKGNVLYSKLRTYLNKVLVAPCDGYCTTEIIPFNSYGGISTDYLTYVLRSAYFVNYTQQCGYGVKMPRLSTSDACKGLIPLPPIAEQERIVMQIKLWSNLIDQMDCNKNNLQNEIVQVKYKILELAVTGKLVPQNPDDEPAAELLKRINPDAEIVTDNGQCQKLPDSWVICQLGDIFNHNTGKALNSSNQEGELLEYITTSNVYWTHFEIDELKLMRYKLSEIEKCQVTKGDLLVCEGGDIGRSAIWNYDWDVMIQNHIHRLRSIQNCASHRLYYYIMMLYKSKDMIGGKGMGLMGLSSKALHQLIVPFPPREEQYRIVAKIEELFSALDIIKDALQA